VLEASKRRDAVLLYREYLMYALIASNSLITLEIPPCNKDLLPSELLSDSQFNLGSCHSGILGCSISQSLQSDMASTSKPYALGFVGLGNMGSQMARNLSVYAKLNSLPPLRLWNRTRSKTEPLAQEIYGEIVSSLEEMAEKCDIVHTCLANDEVALSLYRQFFDTKSAGTIFADHSTLYPTTATLLQREAEMAGMHYLSCPVFGPPAAAKSAQLLIVLSGDVAAKDSVAQYVVPTIGKSFLDTGEEASKGAMMKLLGNNCILGTIELLSESFALAEKSGFESGLFYEFIRMRIPLPLCQIWF
jgi:3-hydroxyisobutyrate dehydrogenase-like beta-hydroxyacid dehydrogenase